MKTKTTLIILAVIMVLLIIYVILMNQKSVDLSTQTANSNRTKNPPVTSCPSGYVLHKGHCVRVLGSA